VWTQNGTSGTLQVENASNVVLESLTLDGTYAQSGFALTESGSVDQITYVSTTVLNKTEFVGSGPGHSGSDSGTTIVAGGNQFVGFDFGTGTATSTTIDSGGTQILGGLNGTGTAIDTTISSGGQQILETDTGRGTATATSTTILSGGSQFLGHGNELSGTATSTTIFIGGVQFVGDDGGTGTATNTILSGGVQGVGNDGGLGDDGIGTATSTTILSGGLQDVSSDEVTATAIDTTISGGRQETVNSITAFVGSEQVVGAGAGEVGAAISTTIDSGGTQFLGFNEGTGTATDTTINNGGIQYVGFGEGSPGAESTGAATSTTISGGGIQYVGEGFGTGTATSTTVLSGGVQYVGGNLNGNGEGFGTATSTMLSGGTQDVEAGGTATGTTIYGGGLEEVLNGGVANAPVIDSGTLRLDAGATIATGPIDFSAVSGTNGGTLDLTGEGSGSAFTSNFTAAISGFTGEGSTAATSDVIDVTGSGNAGDHVVWTQNGAAGTLQVENASNVVLESMVLDGTFGQQRFVLTEAAGVDQITYDSSAPCYCRGTSIRTPRGHKRVEKLKIGDKVMTGGGVARPVKWIGKRSYGGRYIMGRKDMLPICIKAGALADNVPKRDLWISPHHAMYLEDILIEAKDLLNGVSIVQAESVDEVQYFHIELETHDVIVAEGALSESFIDDDSRGMFHNAYEYRMLYPNALPGAVAQYCAPRREDGYEVERARRRIALRAGLQSEAGKSHIGTLRGYIDLISPHCIAGWAQSVNHPEAPVCLDIYAGDKLIGQVLANRYREDLEQADFGSGRHSFEFAPPAGLAFAPDAVEVRRSLDGVALARSAPRTGRKGVAAATGSPNVGVYRRGARN
jgi:autotransporter passenger strand-loop-strand repeat protein